MLLRVSYSIYIPISTAPPLYVTILPSSIVAPNVPPYNTISLKCEGRFPVGVKLNAVLHWKKKNADGFVPIASNGTKTVIRNSKVDQDSISVLTVSDNKNVGNTTYVCVGTAEVSDRVVLENTSTATVRITGT